MAILRAGRTGLTHGISARPADRPLFGVSDGTGEIEIRLGAFDDVPTDLAPTYELWVPRRERWLSALQDAEQFTGNRTAPS